MSANGHSAFMGRMHLFEIHDFACCPSVVRDGLTDFLATSIAKFDNYAPIRPLLFQALRKTGSARVIDLCSGGGGPWQTWSETIPNLPGILLTDKFPNRKAALTPSRAGVDYCPESVDATAVPEHLSGFRTIFTAAHHFRPSVVKQMIDDAVAKRQPIGIFELTHRSPKGVFFVALSGFGVWWLTPRMKHLTWLKLLLTYVLPVIPFVAAFDGVVSCLRTYTPDELQSLAQDPSYEWETGTVPGNPMPVTYLLGVPRLGHGNSELVA